MNLTEEQTKEGKKILLRFVRFQSVSSLHVRSQMLLEIRKYWPTFLDFCCIECGRGWWNPNWCSWCARKCCGVSHYATISTMDDVLIFITAVVREISPDCGKNQNECNALECPWMLWAKGPGMIPRCNTRINKYPCLSSYFPSICNHMRHRSLSSWFPLKTQLTFLISRKPSSRVGSSSCSLKLAMTEYGSSSLLAYGKYQYP